MNVTKSEQKQMDRAAKQGRGALLRTMAIIHRAGSARTQRAIVLAIEQADAAGEFIVINGALLHLAEV
jgi:hypothetical protein